MKPIPILGTSIPSPGHLMDHVRRSEAHKNAKKGLKNSGVSVFDSGFFLGSVWSRVGIACQVFHLQQLMHEQAVSSVKELSLQLVEQALQKAEQDLAQWSGLQNALSFWLQGPAKGDWEPGWLVIFLDV